MIHFFNEIEQSFTIRFVGCVLLLLHPEIKVSDRKVSEIVGAPLSLPAALSFVNWNTNNK